MSEIYIPNAYGVGDMSSPLERMKLDRFHADIVRALRDVSASVTAINITGTQGQSPDDIPDQDTVTGWDDEFEGTELDETGSRRAGAEAWTWYNQGSSTSIQGSGRQVLLHPGSVSDDHSAVMQEAPTAPWVFRAKVALGTTASHGNYFRVGVIAYNDANTHMHHAGISQSGVQAFSANSLSSGGTNHTPLPWQVCVPVYIEMEDDGTDFYVRYSGSGVDGTFVELYSDAGYATLGATPTHVGLAVGNVNNFRTEGFFEWWRRIS